MSTAITDTESEDAAPLYTIGKIEAIDPLPASIVLSNGSRQVLKITPEGQLELEPQDNKEAADLFVTHVYGMINKDRTDLAKAKLRIVLLENALRDIGVQATALGLSWKSVPIDEKDVGMVEGHEVSSEAVTLAGMVADRVATMIIEKMIELKVPTNKTA